MLFCVHQTLPSAQGPQKPFWHDHRACWQALCVCLCVPKGETTAGSWLLEGAGKSRSGLYVHVHACVSECASEGGCSRRWNGIADQDWGKLIHPGTNWGHWDLEASYRAGRVQQESTKEQKALHSRNAKSVSSLYYRSE